MNLKKLSTNNFLILFATLIISMSSIVGLWVNDIHTQSENELINLKQNYIKSQKKILKNVVNLTVKIIEYKRDIENKRKNKQNLKMAQKEALNIARQIRFGPDGYIFIYTDDGVNIMHPIKSSLEGKNLINLKDPNGKPVIKELIKASKSSTNPFVKYLWYQPSTKKIVPKLGYARNVTGWNWMVGSGIYMNSIDNIIKQKKLQIEKRVRDEIIKVIILFLAILFFILYLLYKQSAKINNSFNQFHNVLDKSYKKITMIDLDKIDYIEFKELAKDFNKMLCTVKDNINNLDKIVQEKTIDLAKINKELKQLTNNLEKRVKEEVSKNREKDKQLLQQSKLAQMGEMISMIAHQWRQPLTAISATSASLTLKAKLDNLDNDTVVELSEKISNYSQHLSSTINDFREFFKSNKEKRETTFNELVKSVLNIVEVSITNKNIKLIKILNSNCSFNTYPNEIKQVILNIIKNAEDILLEKRIENPKITIKTEKNILTICDNGGGIPNDILEKIFDPYFSTKTKKDGTGLGLYMSKTIIEKHCDGILSVYNDDKGAVFEIKLPKSNG